VYTPENRTDVGGPRSNPNENENPTGLEMKGPKGERETSYEFGEYGASTDPLGKRKRQEINVTPANQVPGIGDAEPTAKHCCTTQ